MRVVKAAVDTEPTVATVINRARFLFTAGTSNEKRGCASAVTDSADSELVLMPQRCKIIEKKKRKMAHQDMFSPFSLATVSAILNRHIFIVLGSASSSSL